MNRLFRKENKISRMIAFLLAFVMMLSPFLINPGLEHASKAANGEVTPETITPETVTTSEDSIIGSDVLATWDESGITYVGPANSGETTKDYYIATGLQNIQITVSLNLDATASLSGGEQATDYVVKYIEYDAGTSVDSFITTDDADTRIANGSMKDIPDTGIIPVTADASKIIAIYAIPTNENIDTDTTKRAYTLLKQYNVNSVAAFADTDGVYTVTDGTEAKIENCGRVGFSDVVEIHAGNSYLSAKMRYAIVKEGESKDLSDITSWTEDKVVLNASADSSDGGKYTCYVGFLNNAEDAILQYKELESFYRTDDNTAPEISIAGIEYNASADADMDNADWTAIESEHTDTDNNIYYGVAEQYRYKLTVSDSGEGLPASGAVTIADGVGTVKQDASGNYYVVLTKSEATGTITSVNATDKVGNVTEESLELAPRIKKISVVNSINSITFKNTAGDVIVDSDELIDGESHTLLKTDESYILTVKASSGSKITSIVIKDETGATDVFAPFDATYKDTVSVKRTYSADAKFNIPADVSTSASWTNLQIYVTIETDGGSETFNQGIGSFLYDADAPVVTAPDSDCVIQYYDENSSSWADADLTNLSDGIFFAVPGQKYRYVVKVTDEGGSGIKNVTTKIDGSTRKFIQIGTTDDYALELTEGTDYTASEPLTIQVKASDNSGNTSAASYSPVPIQATNTAISIDSVTLYDTTAGKTVNIADVPYVRTGYKLKVSVSSSNKISEVTLNKAGTAYKTINSFADSDNVIDAENRYKVSVEFDIPADVTVNEWFKNMTVSAKDEASNTATRPDDGTYLGTMLYDCTNPVLSAADGSAITVDDNWHKSYLFPYKIVSGNQTANESPLTSASYTFTNSTLNGKNSISVDGVETEVENSIGLVIPTSTSVSGTSIIFAAEDSSGNTLTGNKVFRIKVDPELPDVALTVNGSAEHTIPIVGDVNVNTNVSDNLTLETATITVNGPFGTVTKSLLANGSVEQENISIEKSVSLAALIGTDVADGDYEVIVNAADMAGNPKSAKVSFKVDNSAPVVTAVVASGTAGGKMPKKNSDGTDYDYYMRSNVGVRLTYEDDNISNVVVTDNGNAVNVEWKATGEAGKYTADYTVTSEGRHTIKINATDMSGTPAQEKSVEFVKDTGIPTVTTMINGNTLYTESMGELNLTSDTTVSVSVSDMCVDNEDINFQIIKKVPDQAEVAGKYVKTSTKEYLFAEEADYTFNVYAKDMANNQSAVRSVKFRIDKNAPVITINGVGSGTSANAATVTFNMKEAFWWDATGTVTIYRKAGDGAEETLLKTIDYKPTAYETNVSETFTDTGVYRMEFTASDRVGHTVTTSQSFTIDREAPVITLNGVNNYDVTDQTVEFRAEVKDDFYSSKKVSATGTRTDIDGKVHKITFSGYNQSGNPTTIGESFSEDGIYDIEVTSTDVAGNSHTASVHFIIDKTAPVIGDLSDYDGTILREFKWNIDLDELVSDLTVCDIHMYLNGSEYDGISDIKDGSYVLLITAEDELGHYVEKSVEFVLDTKAPVFIVTGVEDGEVKNEAYSINISLQLEEDSLEAVTLNGKTIEVNNNTAALDVTEKGEYTLKMKAFDEAGNIAEETIEFKFGEESKALNWIIIAICALLLVMIIVIFVVKKRKGNR